MRDKIAEVIREHSVWGDFDYGIDKLSDQIVTSDKFQKLTQAILDLIAKELPEDPYEQGDWEEGWLSYDRAIKHKLEVE